MIRTRSDDAQTLEIFGRWYAAHESRDVAVLAGVLDEDATIRSLFRPAPVRGRDAALAHFVGVTTTFGDMAMALAHGPACAEGRVFAEVEFSGAFTGEFTWDGAARSGSGQRFRVPGVLVVHIADGRVRSVATLFDRDEWLRQIGIPVGSDGLDGAPR